MAFSKKLMPLTLLLMLDFMALSKARSASGRYLQRSNKVKTTEVLVQPEGFHGSQARPIMVLAFK